MLYSVHDLPKRLDLYDKADWQNGALGRGQQRQLEITISRDPLHWPEFGMEFHALWGFDVSTGQLAILLGDPIGEFNSSACRYEDRRGRIKLFSALAPRLIGISRFYPKLNEVLSLIAPTNGTPHQPFDQFVGEIELLRSGAYVMEWARGAELIIGAVLDRSSVWSERGGAHLLVDRFKEKFRGSIGRVYDYYFYKQRILKSVPSCLFTCHEDNVDLLTRVFSDPLAFDPRDEIPPDAFLWPWQRSIGHRSKPDGSSEIYYRPIPTTSLVLDLRASTTAMDLSVESAAFAQLIDDIVEEAREIIVRHDGFFDKETGDGVVGHFCHATSASIQKSRRAEAPLPNVPHRAVQAAIEIVRAVQSRCMAYQTCLIHGLRGFGPAVGIHTGNSVWLVDGSQIRAIGPAVVGAARLCARASASGVILSNHAFQEYAKDVSPRHLSSFEKRSIEIQEYQERAGLYGHVLRLTENL